MNGDAADIEKFELTAQNDKLIISLVGEKTTVEDLLVIQAIAKGGSSATALVKIVYQEAESFLGSLGVAQF